MDHKLLNIHFDYAWKYFSMHAEQRLKAFHFFILFASLTMGAFTLLLVNIGAHKPFALIPACLIYITYVFWHLDHRTKMLIRNAESSLRNLEDILRKNSVQYDTDALALITNDDNTFQSTRKLWQVTLSYSQCFNRVYLTVFLIALTALLYCFL